MKNTEAEGSETRDSKTESPETESLEQDFHGAALIDQDGKELPITEDMVQTACHKLDPEDEQNGS